MAKRGRKKKAAAAKASTSKSKRGRKPIFTAAQKSTLERMIKVALAEQLRKVVRGMK